MCVSSSLFILFATRERLPMPSLSHLTRAPFSPSLPPSHPPSLSLSLSHTRTHTHTGRSALRRSARGGRSPLASSKEPHRGGVLPFPRFFSHPRPNRPPTPRKAKPPLTPHGTPRPCDRRRRCEFKKSPKKQKKTHSFCLSLNVAPLLLPHVQNVIQKGQKHAPKNHFLCPFLATAALARDALARLGGGGGGGGGSRPTVTCATRRPSRPARGGAPCSLLGGVGARFCRAVGARIRRDGYRDCHGVRRGAGRGGRRGGRREGRRGGRRGGRSGRHVSDELTACAGEGCGGCRAWRVGRER